MKPILVTGGAGYVGSHTCKALARVGYLPVVLDNLSTGHSWAVKWGPLVEGEIADRVLVRETLEKYRPGAVLHFAANALVGESMQNPYKYLHDNVTGSIGLLEGMREAGVRRIIFSSTCAVYGVRLDTPIPEQASQAPTNPYGDSKLFIERVLQWYERLHGFAWTALRYFNAAGADLEGELGERHEPETHLIPLVIGAALGVLPPVEIMGTDYPTPDGTAIRDYIHVEDIAQAHVKALEYLDQGGESTALNLGTARGHSVRAVIAAVERVSGVRIPVREAPRRPGDPSVLVADNRRARQLLSWQPKYERLDDIIRTSWEWHASFVPGVSGSRGPAPA